MLNKIKIFLEFLGIIIFILFEELIWDKFIYPFKNFLSKIISQHIKVWIAARTSYQGLILFIIPFVIAESLGFISAYYISLGYVLIAIIIYLIKIAIASISFLIFNILKEKLLTIYYFERSYYYINFIFNYLKNTYVYINIKNKYSLFKKYFKNKNNFKYLKERYFLIKEKFQE